MRHVPPSHERHTPQSPSPAHRDARAASPFAAAPGTTAARPATATAARPAPLSQPRRLSRPERVRAMRSNVGPSMAATSMRTPRAVSRCPGRRPGAGQVGPRRTASTATDSATRRAANWLHTNRCEFHTVPATVSAPYSATVPMTFITVAATAATPSAHGSARLDPRRAVGCQPPPRQTRFEQNDVVGGRRFTARCRQCASPSSSARPPCRSSRAPRLLSP